jgi:acyl-CoA synthetase (AMP-forming)/AMP-acid ligase II
MNIANLLARAGRAYADRHAVVVGLDVIADYATLAHRAAAIAQGLGDRFRLSRDERVALVMRNCAAYIEALFACWWGGFVAVPVNAKLHPREIAFILDNCSASVCFVTGDLADALTSKRRAPRFTTRSSPSRKQTMRPSPRSNRGRSRAARRRTRRGSSTRAAPPAAPRARCSVTATCWR